MSICIAWVKNNKSYLIADTLTSSTQNITLSKTTPFLQNKEYLNGYYVEEEGLKIYEISKDFAVAVTGDVPSYCEIIRWIYELKECKSIPEILELLQENFRHLLVNIKMIFLYKKSRKNRIIVWNGCCIYEPEDTSTPVFIGSGSENTKFVKAVNEAISSNDDTDSHRYLALIVSFVQCLSMKLKTIRCGFGGTFYGLFVSSQIQWMRDLEYVLLAKNGSVLQSISVIIRKSSVIISSSMEGTTRTLANNHLNEEWFSEYHNMKAIKRAVDTKEAFYYIFYGLKSNKIYLWEAKGILIRNDFRKWIRRGDKRVDYLYAIDPTISKLITGGKNKILEPKGYILETAGSTYLSFDKVCLDVVKQLRKAKCLVGYDFDLSKMHLEVLLRHCLQNDYYVEYSKIKIIVVKNENEDDFTINGINIASWFQTYHNCSFIITNNKEKDLAQLLIYWIKEYYINEKYFHLGMNVLMADNTILGQILDLLIPHERRYQKAADWILVRMNNNETSMSGDFNYVNEEWAFLDLLNSGVGYPLQQETAITEREQELLSGRGKEVAHDWIENNSLFNNVIQIDPTKV